MKRISSSVLGLALVVTFFASGCEAKKELPYDTFNVPAEPYKIGTDQSNAFDGYASAAIECNKLTQKYSNQASFRPFERDAIIGQTSSAVTKLITATHKKSEFVFTPTDPFLPTPYHGGWTMLGRVLAWRITRAGEREEWAEVARLGVAAVKFGTDLTGGGATDAILGHWIVAEARRSIVPFLPQMDSSALNSLADGIAQALESAPPFDQTLANEEANMLAGVQFIQDAYQEGDYDLLEKAMYKEVREAIDYLKNIDPDERPAYFQGFAAEARTIVNFTRQQSSIPTAERKEFKFDTRAVRPWKRFAKQLLETIPPLVESNDMFLARTRLLALTCRATAIARKTSQAPREFNFEKGSLTIDPYTGRPFVYHAAGREFRIYSVGADGRDDGGDSSLEGKEPDLLLDPAPL
ncbi:hypothetical protein QPK87_09930 [Kamptonema cortianum]|nr:hypothetical protein [Geitlerinema splendidum]MDK3156894.1 hypothetical protein [Kamptonema cortianum]